MTHSLLAALMVFSLPSESGEKVGLGINSMLAMMVFLMAMTERLPPTQKLPLAGMWVWMVIGSMVWCLEGVEVEREAYVLVEH